MMSTKNSEYWEERIAKETWRTYNDIEEKNIDLIKMYDKTSQSIKKELYALAEKAEESGSLTRSEQYRFNKLLGQQGYIYREIEKLGEQVENHAKKQMFDGGKRVYGNIMDELGIENFNYPNKKQMEQMLRRPWKGSFFSERLWKETGKLEKNLNGIIKEGMATGKTVTEMAVQLSNIMQKSFNDAHRLIRSETVTYLNRSAVNGYKDAGVKKVQWWAAEDERMCEICGAMHGKEYPVDNVPLAPHPGCRCTRIPALDTEIKKIDILNIKSNKSVDENKKLTDYANKSLRIETADLKGLDFKATKNLLNTIADVYNKYPELNGSIKQIIQTNEASMAVGIVDGYNSFILAVGNKIYSNPVEAQKAIDKTIKSGVFAKGTTIDTIPYHEIGHMFEGNFINNNYQDSDKERAWDECLGATKVLKKASTKCYNDENEYKKDLSKISSYALESDSEGLAECIHLELTGRGTAFTNTVLKILRGEKHG